MQFDPGDEEQNCWCILTLSWLLWVILDVLQSTSNVLIHAALELPTILFSKHHNDRLSSDSSLLATAVLWMAKGRDFQLPVPVPASGRGTQTFFASCMQHAGQLMPMATCHGGNGTEDP